MVTNPAVAKPPSINSRSIKTTFFAPARFADKAAAIPAIPPPTTATEYSSIMGIFFDFSLIVFMLSPLYFFNKPTKSAFFNIPSPQKYVCLYNTCLLDVFP